jgi:hypothetical protein
MGLCTFTYSSKEAQLGAKVRDAARKASEALTALVDCNELGSAAF